MPMELVRNLPYDHPYRWDGTLFGGPKLWRPTEISTALWLDAEDASTITLNGSTVSQWNDKSGNGRNVAQSIGSAQPTYNSTGLNGKPNLSFNGANWLTGVSNLGISGNPLFTIAGILTISSLPSSSMVVSWGSPPVGNAFHYMGANSGNTMWTGFAGGTQIGTATLNTPTSAHTFVLSRRDTATANWIVNQNGSSLSVTQGNSATVNIINAPIQIGQWVGGGLYPTMTLAEFVILPGLIDTSNIQRLEGYLAWKWGLEANLPANHPYKSLPPTV